MCVPADTEELIIDLLFGIGKKALKQGKYACAIQHVGFGIKQFPQESKLHSLLGVAYFKVKEFHKARRCTNTAIELDPGNGYAHLLDFKLIKQGYHWDETVEKATGDDDDSDPGPEPNAGVPRRPKDPAPTSGIALDPHEVPICIP